MPRPIFLILIVLTILVSFYSINQSLYADEFNGEKIDYLISPVGRAEYKDFGIVDLNGKKARLITFTTHVLWFDDTEKIYAQPDNLLPIKIERDVTKLFGKEFIVEDYDQNNFTLVLTKFKGNKKISERTIKAEGPIHNAILVAFYPRLQPSLQIGWNFLIRVPNKFEVSLVSIEEITVPAGKFTTYHFTSNPDKFEIWVSKDKPFIPVKITGKGGFKYAFVMDKYTAITNQKK